MNVKDILRQPHPNFSLLEAWAQDLTAVNAQDSRHRSLAWNMAAYQNYESMFWLLDQGADPYQALEGLIFYESRPMDMLEILLKRISDINVILPHGQLLLHHLIKNQWVEAIDYVLTHHHVDLSRTNQDNRSVFSTAIHYFKTPEILSLLQLHVPSDFFNTHRSGRQGNSLLHEAVGYSNLPALQWLMNQSLNVNVQNSLQETPLMRAVTQCSYPTTQILLKHGADVEIPDQNGKTPLYHAVARGSYDIACALLEKGADPMRRTGKKQQGHSPIRLLQKNAAAPRSKILTHIEKNALLSIMNHSPMLQKTHPKL